MISAVLSQGELDIRRLTKCILPVNGTVRLGSAEIHRRGLQNHFTFVADTLAVSNYMTSAMDCFVFLSRYEGLGLVVI